MQVFIEKWLHSKYVSKKTESLIYDLAVRQEFFQSSVNIGIFTRFELYKKNIFFSEHSYTSEAARIRNINNDVANIFTFFHGARAPSGPGPPHCQGFTITLRHTTLGRTPLDEWSARSRDLYLTTHNTHKRQTSTHPAEFEPPQSQQTSSRRPTPQTERTAGIGVTYTTGIKLLLN